MNRRERPRYRNLAFWTALVAPAFAWFFQLTASYTIAAYACAHDQMWILHAISVAALAIATFGLLSGWKNWRLPRSRGDDPGRERARLSGGAFLLAILFVLAIVVTELSNWLLEPCI